MSLEIIKAQELSHGHMQEWSPMMYSQTGICSVGLYGKEAIVGFH